MAMIIASVNGERPWIEHPGLPTNGRELAQDVERVVQSGADIVHVHARSADGAQSLTASAVRETLVVIRAAVGDVPISLSTSARAEPDPDRLVALVRSWVVLPDLATVDVWQEGGHRYSGHCLG